MIYPLLFFTFFKIGLFTFGGGYAMLPLIRSEVLAKSWTTLEELVNFIAVSESTPGPFAINIATYIGAECGGIFGSVCATLGVVMPSFLIILIVARFFQQFKESLIVRGLMTGLRPAVIGLIATAVLSVGETVLFPNGVSAAIFSDWRLYVSLGIFAGATVLAFRKVHPILILCLSAVIGIATGFLLP